MPRALAWDQKPLEIQAEPGQERAEATFPFRGGHAARAAGGHPGDAGPGPAHVQWPRGQTAEAKAVTIHTTAKGVTMQGLDFDTKQIEATIEPLPAGDGCQVRLRPLTTAEPLRQTVQLRVRIGETKRSLPIYVYVR